MPLEVTERTVDGVIILDLDGRLVMGQEATEARSRLNDAAGSEVKNLLVNLQKVGHIDSTGLGMLVLGRSAMQEVGGTMKLLHLSKRHLELMVLSKLITIFEVFDDEQVAINSFYSDREVKHFDILEFVKSQEGEKKTLGSEDTTASNSGAE